MAYRTLTWTQEAIKKESNDVIKSKCRLSTFEGDVCPYVEKAKEEGRLQGALGEVALMKLCIQNEGSWKGIQEHIEKRLKELNKKVV